MAEKCHLLVGSSSPVRQSRSFNIFLLDAQTTTPFHSIIELTASVCSLPVRNVSPVCQFHIFRV